MNGVPLNHKSASFVSGAEVYGLGVANVNVSGTGYGIGGLARCNNGTVANCYGAGKVSGNECVGGLVGRNKSRGSIVTSYSAGTVNGETRVGGLVGVNAGGIAPSFWDVETSGLTSSAGGTGKTTAQMKQQLAFTDWDFINTWAIGEGQTCPYLQKYSAADINEDESVNFGDLAILAENWLGHIAP